MASKGLTYVCLVCGEKIENGSDVAVTPCGHIFHESCFDLTMLLDEDPCYACEKHIDLNRCKYMRFGGDGEPQKQGKPDQDKKNDENKEQVMTDKKSPNEDGKEPVKAGQKRKTYSELEEELAEEKESNKKLRKEVSELQAKLLETKGNAYDAIIKKEKAEAEAKKKGVLLKNKGKKTNDKKK